MSTPNWSRFAPFHGQLEHVVVDSNGLDAFYPQARREGTDWRGARTSCARAPGSAHDHRALEPDAVVIWGDVDELLPR